MESAGVWAPTDFRVNQKVYSLLRVRFTQLDKPLTLADPHFSVLERHSSDRSTNAVRVDGVDDSAHSCSLCRYGPSKDEHRGKQHLENHSSLYNDFGCRLKTQEITGQPVWPLRLSASRAATQRRLVGEARIGSSASAPCGAQDTEEATQVWASVAERLLASGDLDGLGSGEFFVLVVAPVAIRRSL
jgi:hypothetical protein